MRHLGIITLTVALALPALVLAGDMDKEPHGVPADNTEKNVRDRDGGALVPTDQAKGSDADVALTTKIRKAIVADDALSMNAHNVKIITLNGVATLRGPVKDGAEKARVGDLAAQAAGAPTHIKNELDVAP